LYEGAFGLALGLGVVTVVPYTSMYALLLSVVFIGDSAIAILSMAIFGFARAMPMLMVATNAVLPSPGTMASGAAGRLGLAMERSAMKAIRLLAGVAVVTCLLVRLDSDVDRHDMTDSELYSIDSLGLVRVRAAIPEATAARLSETLANHSHGRPVAKAEILSIGPEFFELMVHPWTLVACERILGPGFRLDHAFGLTQPPAPPNLHGGPLTCQGSCFYHSSPSRTPAFSVGRISVGIALTAQTAATGGFCYIPGSHKSSFSAHGSRVHSELLSGDFRDSTIVVPDLLPGDLCMFPDSLVHGTTPWSGSDVRRALYYMYSPGFMAWRPYAEIERHVTGATSEVQRRLLRPPFVAQMPRDGETLLGNRWREPTRPPVEQSGVRNVPRTSGRLS
jgi:hypothetical protein